MGCSGGRLFGAGRPRAGLEAAGGSREGRGGSRARTAPRQKPACADTPSLQSSGVRTGRTCAHSPSQPLSHRLDLLVGQPPRVGRGGRNPTREEPALRRAVVGRRKEVAGEKGLRWKKAWEAKRRVGKKKPSIRSPEGAPKSGFSSWIYTGGPEPSRTSFQT